MIRVSLRDVLIPQAKDIRSGAAPTNISFDRNPFREHAITFFTNKSLGEAKFSDSRVKIAWILESQEIGDIYEQITKPEVYEQFNYILTHKKDLLKLDKRFVFCPSDNQATADDLGKILSKLPKCKDILREYNE